MTKAMVVLSGGQDSTTCLFWAKQKFADVHSITFNYGQKHQLEIESAKKISEMAEVSSHQIIDLPNVLKGRSPLTNPDIALETYNDYAEMDKTIGDRVEKTFVPMRNAFFLTLAANYALEKDCFNLVTGVCQGDNANYPDCRQSFITQQEKTVNEALGINNFTIHTPLMALSKADIVRLADNLDGCMSAMAYSHTCYSGVFPPCGKCHSCVLRAYGFAEAGIEDPLVAKKHLRTPEGLL